MARRVNRNFLLILIVVGLGAGLAALVGPTIANKVFKAKGDPAKLIAEGDELLAKGENEQARDKFLHATRADPNHTMAWVRLGDAFAKMTPDDPAYLQAAESSWNRALAIDPKFVPAMSRLIDSYSDFLDFAPRADLFAKVRDLSARQLSVEPGNKEAASRKAVATIRQWLSTQTTSTEDINKTLQEIRELMRTDPGNPDLPFWLAQARVRQARDLLGTGQAQLAETAFKDVTTMLEIACEQQPNNGPMHFNAYRVYNLLDKVDPKTRDNPKDDRYKTRAAKAIATAQTKTTDKQEQYYDTQILAAEWLRQQGKPEDAEKVVRTMYDGHKEDQRARLAMARMLKQKPETRAEAAAILSQPMTPDDGATGFKALLRREMEAQTLHELVLLRLGEYATANAAKDADKRKAAETGIEEGLDKLRRLTSAKAMRVMDLEGRLALLKGDNVAAVKALEDAVAQMTSAADYDVMYLLAQAYLTTSQPGQARGLLERIVKDVPTWTQPRLRLTEMMLQEGNADAARKHIDELKKHPAQTEEQKKEIVRLEQTATVLSKAPGSDEVFKQMPEETREDRMRKAQFAVLREKYDDAVRLLKLVLAENTTSGAEARDPVRSLVAIYENRKQQDRAVEVVDAALAQFPDDPMLRLMKLGVNNASADQIGKHRRDEANKIENEFDRLVALYDVERGPGGDASKALPYLERAFDIKPTDRRVLDQLYANAVQRRDWAKAEVYLGKLVEINADECEGLLYRQRYAMARGNYQTADDLGLQLVTKYKEFAASWLALAQAQQALGKFAEAAESYLQVKLRQPKHYEALRGLVDCYYQVNRPEDARIYLEEGHRHFPKDTVFRELRLNHMVNFGNPREAIADREKLLKENLEEPGYYLALAGTLFHAGQFVATDTKANPGTKDYLKKAFETLYAGAQKFPDDGRFYAQMAEMHQYENRVEMGEQVLRAYAKRPAVEGKPGPYLLLVDYYTRIGRMDLAEVFLVDAMNRAEGEEKRNVLLRLSAVQTQLKNYPKALDTLATAGRTDDLRVIRQRIEILIAQGNLSAAMVEITETLKTRESADFRNLEASILIDTGKVAEAFKRLEIAQRLEPRSEVTRYLIALAKAKSPQPDVEGGIKDLIEIRNRNPRNMQVRLLLAELYSNTGRGKGAISELTDALEKVPLNKDVRSKLIQLYRGQRPAPNFDAAMKLIADALASPVLKNDPVWWREKAIIHMAKKEYQEAIGAIDQAVALAPDKLEFHRERLDMILQFNDYDAVIRESQKLLDAGHDTWWLRHQRMLAFAKLRDESKHAQAVVECDRGLALCDKVGDIQTAEFMLRGLAGAVRPMGYDEAIKRVKARLAGGDPDNRWNLLLIALHRGKGDFPTAQALVEQMLANPANKEPARRISVLRAAADVYQNAKPPDYAKTKKMYVELLTLLPEDLATLNNLAYLNLDSKNAAEIQQAKVYSGRAYQISRYSGSPNDLVFDTHGWVLTMCGGADAADGLKILQDVVKRRPEFVEGIYHLGESYMRQERPQFAQAQQELQRGLELIAQQEQAAKTVGEDLDALTVALRDKIQDALARAKSQTLPK